MISKSGQTSRLCYASDGILQYYPVETGNGLASEMTATSVTHEIEDAVFILPV